MILVTGASGHLGNVLVRALLERGHHVRVLLRRPPSPALEGLDVEVVRGDLFDQPAIEAACDGAEWIFHCAAMISTIERNTRAVERVNVLGTRNMIDAALNCGAERFVYVSSVEALNLRVHGAPISEMAIDPANSMMSYGRSKARASLDVLEAARERGLPAVIGIPSGLTGPYDFGSSRTAEMVRRFLAHRIPGYVEGGFDFVDVRDVADGLIAAAQRGRVGESYLLTGELHSYLELTEMLEQITGVRRPRLRAPYWLAMPFTYLATGFSLLTGGEPLYTPNSLRILQTWPHFDLEKSTTELGYRPRPIFESLSDTAAWVQGRYAEVTEERG